MLLKPMFNAILAQHSRAAVLKRFGTPDIYSPIRITPANFFRFLEGPGPSTIHGREFVIPVDTIKGHWTQIIKFVDIDGEPYVPTQGKYHLTYNAMDTAVLDFDADNSDVETALQALTGLSNITVTGDTTDGFLVTFIGVNNPYLLTGTSEVTPDDLDATIFIEASAGAAWTAPIITRGDKIIDTIFGHLALDEVIEMNDFGGSILGYRCRCE